MNTVWTKNMFILSLLAFFTTVNSQKLFIAYDNHSPQMQFAINTLSRSLAAHSFETKVKSLQSVSDISSGIIRIGLINSKALQRHLIRHGINLGTIERQGFVIKTSNTRIPDYLVIASDIDGLMNGTIQLSDHFKQHNYGIKVSEHCSPFIKKRVYQMYVPLDWRTLETPYETEMVENNISNIWDFSFWTEQIDMLAKNKYNVLALKNPNPFSSMMMEEDGHKSLANVIGTDSSLILKAKIKKKIEFWKSVFDYAGSRGMEIHWHFKGLDYPLHNSEPIILQQDKLVRFLGTYNQIKTIAYTSKGNHEIASCISSYNTSHKPVEVIELDHINVLSDLRPSEVNNMVSAIRKGANPGSTVSINWINCSTNDNFYFRSIQQDRIQELFTTLKAAHVSIDGLIMGSKNYVFGKTFSFNESHKEYNEQLEIDKQWLSTLAWGTMAFAPETETSFFEDQISYRYNCDNPEDLLEIWQKASSIFPMVNTIINQVDNNIWFVEGCWSYDGFINTDEMANSTSLKNSGNVNSIEQNLSDLIKTSNAVSKQLTKFNNGLSEELIMLLQDIRCMASAGLYYAYKMKSAKQYAEGNLSEAQINLRQALRHLSVYTAMASKQYKGQLFSSNYTTNEGYEWDKLSFTWDGLLTSGQNDLESLRATAENKGKQLQATTETFGQ